MNELVPSPARPPDVPDLMTLARTFTASGFFADVRDAAQAIVKVLAGRELGFSPIASMTGVNIIKGRVTLSANLIAAAVRKSNRYDYVVKRLDDQVCQLEFTDNGRVVGTSAFSLEDAKRAGLTGDNWRSIPATCFSQGRFRMVRSGIAPTFSVAVSTHPTRSIHPSSLMRKPARFSKSNLQRQAS